MTRPLRILGATLIFSLLLLCLYRSGWTEERYVVKPGDSLYSISRAFGISVEALKTANHLEGNSIRSKQALSIPSTRSKKVVQVNGKVSHSPSPKPSVKTARKDPENIDSYMVRKGDTLSGISKKAGLSIDEIKRVNNLHTASLKVGQMLSFRKRQDQRSEDLEDSEDEDEGSELTQVDSDKGEGTDKTSIGKWNNPEERSLLVRVVKTFLGVPYQLGGSTLKGIDCSAFVKKIYEIFSIELPRTTREQFWIGKKIGKEQLEEGDLVFFRRRGSSSHVGIYIGDNQFVHASSHNRQVKIDDLDTPYYSQRFLRGVRVKELEKEI